MKAKTIMTLKQALRQARLDLKADNVSYLSGPRRYDSDKGEIFVRNASAKDGSSLCGIFEAELTDKSGNTVDIYKL